MAVRNPTVWTPPSGTGFAIPSTGAAIQTQSLSNLTTESGTTLNIQPQTYKQRYATSWNQSTKNRSKWQPPSGNGYIVTVGTRYIISNSNSFIITNGGDNLVTNTTYTSPRNITQWTISGA